MREMTERPANVMDIRGLPGEATKTAQVKSKRVRQLQAAKFGFG